MVEKRYARYYRPKDERGEGNVGEFVIGSDGYLRNHKRLCDRYLKNTIGTITIKRLGYSSRNVGSLFPEVQTIKLTQRLLFF